MRVNLTPEVLEQLRNRRAQRAYVDELTKEHDAFVLDGGLGPVFYLTSEGRVLVDASAWDEDDQTLREATEDEGIAALVVGAEKTGISGLLTMIPPAPPGSHVCTKCNGHRWMYLAHDVKGQPTEIVCTQCSGRGWAG